MMGFGRQPWNGRRRRGHQYFKANGNSISHIAALTENGYRTIGSRKPNEQQQRFGAAPDQDLETSVFLLDEESPVSPEKVSKLLCYIACIKTPKLRDA